MEAVEATYLQAFGCSFNYTNLTILNVTELCGGIGTCKEIVPNTTYACSCTYLGNGQSYVAGDYCDESFFAFYRNHPVTMIVPVFFLVANLILSIFGFLDLLLEFKKPGCTWKRLVSACFFLFLICQTYATLPQEGGMLVVLYLGPWLALVMLVLLMVMWSGLTEKMKKLKIDKKESTGIVLMKRLGVFLVCVLSVVAVTCILAANIIPGKSSKLEVAAYVIILSSIFFVVLFATIADFLAYPVLFGSENEVIHRKFYWEISNKVVSWCFIACCPIYFVVRGPRTWLAFRVVLSSFELLFAITAFMTTKIEYDSFKDVRDRLTGESTRSGGGDSYHKLAD